MCQLKNGNSESYLIKECPFCVNSSPPAAKYTKDDAMSDGKNLCRTLNATLKPKYQMVEPDKIVELFGDNLKRIIREADKPSYLEAVFEYTKAGVLHLHGFACCRAKTFCKITSYLRRFGFVKTIDVFDLREWITYMYKDHVEEENYKPISVVT